MPFLDHLEELRWRILWSLLALLIGTIVGWLLLDRIDLIEILKRPIAPYLPGGRLIFTSPAEPFMLTVKVAFALGCLLASPVVIYQIWAFLAPALYEREKKLIVPALFVGVVLFLGGAIACYQWLLPAALKVLLNFQRTDLTAMITIDRYFGMAVPFVIGCGLVAELPLVVTILASLGIVTPQFLSRQRRYAIVIAAFLAALLTPPDAVSMMLMLGPLLLLYEVSIWCAWVASRRRARRLAAAAVVLLVLAMGGMGSLQAQNPPPPPTPPPAQRPAQRDTSRAARDSLAGRGQNVDTATARRLGLPTAPTRTFPAADRIIDSLLKLEGFRVTRYVAETLVVEGDSQTIFLRREAFVERDGTQLEADSIRYHEASCRLDAAGDPHLFDQGTVLVGEGMRYDTCERRGTVRDALTDFQQGGAKWFVRGDIAADSGNRRVYIGGAEFTSDPQPVPDYHFAAGQVKWINKSTMVARPAVLYVRDVPVMWLPFLFQDIRGGRRSGILFPRFGLNDIVRPTRTYSRHITDFGYYFAINNYVDALVSADWFAGRSASIHAQAQYRWIDRFMNGQLSYTRTNQFDPEATNSRIGWSHSQRFNASTDFNASIDYMTNGRVVQNNSIDPYEVKATVGSTASFNKRFSWASLNIGFSRRQDLSSNHIDQTFPVITLTPTTVTLAPWLTWSPGFTYTNTQSFNNLGTLLIPPPPGDTGVDTLRLHFGDRLTNISLQTPFRLGRWNWSNSITIQDANANARRDFTLVDSTGASHNITFASFYETRVNWETGINLPTLFTGTWKIQPGVAIVNKTSAGPFMIRNPFTGGAFIQQGKRLAFTLSSSPTFFGFFPGFGPLSRIRHSFSPLISYQYAPGAEVSPDFARAIDPTGRTHNAHSDPQQTISIGLSQNFEAKVKPAAGDTAGEREPRKIKLLSINTSGISYNFEQAKIDSLTGWQTGTLSNTFASDLVPGFQLGIVHDLWRGQVGTDTAKFDPFLTSVNASFQITPATIAGLSRLLGLRPRPVPPPPPDTTQGPQRDSNNFRQYQGATRDPYGMAGGPYGGGGRGQFNLGVTFTSSRNRLDQARDRERAGRETMGLNLSFSPTHNWTATWRTSFDMVTQQFADHSLTFQRDLRRWRASFSFYKTGAGNMAFSFNIVLTDQPDIKMDYDQRTYAQ
jgi:sec-independent protein translocase protein TatC